MLDNFGGIFITLYIGSILLVAFRRAHRARAVTTLVAALAVWLSAQAGILLATTSAGAGPLPPNVLMFGLSLLMLTGAWLFVPAFRQAAAATPYESLIGLHAWRLGGFVFLLLYAADRLPQPFASVAAIGDFITGAIAAGLALAMLRGRRPGFHVINLWNGFGLLDLLIAMGLALLSTPGAPFQVFTDVPAHSAFTAPPWVLVPAVIVPALFFVHLAIFLKLKGETRLQPKEATA